MRGRVHDARRRLVAAGSAAVLALLGGVLVVLAGAPAAHADTAPPDPSTPTTVSADALPTVQINGVVWAQVTVGNTVFATGSFTQARPAGAAAGTNQTPRGNLLAYDITTGNLITGFNHTLNAQGRSITASPDGNTLYVGGDFTTVDGVTHNHIASFNIVKGSLNSGFAPTIGNSVLALAATNSTVYAGGAFGTAGGFNRAHLAAFNATNGALLSWAPSAADNQVQALVLTPDNSMLIVGGKFDALNGVPALGLGAVSTSTGATLPWAANQKINDSGNVAGITSLRTDGSKIYGTGYVFGPGGNLEGSFAADPDSGAVIWIEDCHGDSYDTFATGQVMYVVSHEHYCGNIGAWPQTSPNWTYHRATAFTTYPTQTISHDPYPEYADWYGNPAPTQLDWYPTLTAGTYTGQTQAAWSATGNASYLALGGEFPSVNGTAQQGLVRFAIRTLAPNKVGPVFANTLTPSLVSLAPGTVRVSWTTTYDVDNEALTYKVIRDGNVNNPVYTKTVNSKFWTTAPTGFTDTGLTPGSTHTYQVRVYDPFGNTTNGFTASVQVSSGSTSQYAKDVLADGAQDYWRLGETTGTTGYDWAAFNDLTEGSGVGHSATGAIIGDSNAASTFDGTSKGTAGSVSSQVAPDTFTEEAWVHTTSTSGGKIVGLGNAQLGSSSVFDRQLYMDNAGHLLFGVYSNGRVATLSSQLTYNDGQWHHVVGTLSAAGMVLYMDGRPLGANQNVTSGQPFTGYWRVGGDNLAGWTNAPSSNFLQGTIDEVAIYPTALSPTQVQQHYVDSGRSPVAAFAATCTNLSCTFDGTGSTDPQGTVTSYAWDFGDGAAGTGATPTHAYATAGTYTVTLTVTDNQGATNQVSHPVSPAASANQRPTAAFTATCTDLTCAFDGTGSTDPDGTVASYSWDFGDGTASTGGAPSHAYTTPGTYTVTLTVTDNLGATNQVSHTVGPTAPANQPPTASFTSSCTGLGCTFNGTGSTDPDGTIASWSWRFGDGTTGTGFQASHNYAAAGDYTVTLTVTDNQGATGTTSQVVSPRPPANPTTSPYAVDTFNRTVKSGLGTADTGGAWTTTGGTGPRSVSPGAATLALGSPGAQTGAYLGGVSATDAETDMTVAASGVGTGNGTYLYVVGRRTGTNNEYRGRARILPNGSVALAITALAGTSTEKILAGETTLPGITYTPGTQLKIRFQVFGTNPTTLRLKVWPASATEPANWQVTTTDSTTSLQNPGAVGLTSYLSASSTNAPVTVTVTAFRAFPTAQPPTAAFTISCTGLGCSVDGSGSSDPNGPLGSYAWSWGDGVVTSGVTSTHTYRGGGTYRITLTVTDPSGLTNVTTRTVTVGA